MTFGDFVGLVALPLGILTYASAVTTFTIGLRMIRRKAKLPIHRAAARATVVLATLHAAANVSLMFLR